MLLRIPRIRKLRAITKSIQLCTVAHELVKIKKLLRKNFRINWVIKMNLKVTVVILGTVKFCNRIALMLIINNQYRKIDLSKISPIR